MRSKVLSIILLLAVVAVSIFIALNLAYAQDVPAPPAPAPSRGLWDIVFTILELASPIIVGVITWFGARIGALVNSRVKNDYLRGVLARLNDVVWMTVKGLEQTMVSQLKAARADGKLTDQERANIRQTAIFYVKSFYGAKGIAELAKILGLESAVLDNFIGSRVEAAVHDLRATTPPRAVPFAAPSANPGAVGAPLSGPFGQRPGLTPP